MSQQQNYSYYVTCRPCCERPTRLECRRVNEWMRHPRRSWRRVRRAMNERSERGEERDRKRDKEPTLPPASGQNGNQIALSGATRRPSLCEWISRDCLRHTTVLSSYSSIRHLPPLHTSRQSPSSPNPLRQILSQNIIYVYFFPNSPSSATLIRLLTNRPSCACCWPVVLHNYYSPNIYLFMELFTKPVRGGWPIKNTTQLFPPVLKTEGHQSLHTSTSQHVVYSAL